MLAIDLTNLDIHAGGQIAVPRHTLHAVRSVFLWRNMAYRRLAVRNHGDRAAASWLAISVNSDFADLFEVRGLRRQHRGVMGPDEVVGFDDLLKLGRKMFVHPHIAGEIAPRELGEVQPEMQDRP
jgi:glycogen debranching enzyme